MVEIRTPGLQWWLKHLETDFNPVHSVDLFGDALKRRSIRSPTPSAVGTSQLLLRLIAAHKFTTIKSLVDYILSIDANLSSVCQRELSIRNMVRRVLGIVREEAENNGMGEFFKLAMAMGEEDALPKESTTASSSNRTPHAQFTFNSGTQASVTGLFSILSQSATPVTASAATSPSRSGVQTPVNLSHSQQLSSLSCIPLLQQKDIRPSVIQDIQELIEELESSESSIAEYAPQVVYKNEVILTYGLPLTVHRLLLRAAHKREHTFTVVIVEASQNVYKRTHSTVMNKLPLDDMLSAESPELEGEARKSLQERGVQVIVISDADIYNFIHLINKVLIAANYVLADGSVLAASGSLNIAGAAKAFQKPVIVIAGSHVLSPITSFNQEQALVEMGSPFAAVGFEEGYLLNKSDSFLNPLVDIIDPEFVTLFVTNNGIVSKSAINRATLDLYHMSEADLL